MIFALHNENAEPLLHGLAVEPRLSGVGPGHGVPFRSYSFLLIHAITPCLLKIVNY